MDWENNYYNRIERNIGIVSILEQDKIKNSNIAILGTGGIGAPAALELCYAGVQNFVLVDNDKIEISNLNRQPFTMNDLGKYKVEVLSHKLKSIDPNIKVKTYYNIENNLDEILNGVDIVALTLDDPIASIVISRKCRDKKIPIAESWAIPYLFCWWFLPNSLEYEKVYEFETENFSIEQLLNSKNELITKLKSKIINQLLKFTGIEKKYSRESGTFEKMLNGQISFRSFSTITWLNSSYLANEIIFAGILNIKQKVISPKISAFDYFYIS